MSREADFKARMVADTALMLILTGGVFTAESTGIEGLTRETTGAAFDANGYLKPCSLVKQRALVPTSDVVDYDIHANSASQTVECWLYCDPVAGYAPLDAAADRLFILFHGHQLSGSFEIYLSNRLDRLRDTGALKNASCIKLDFTVPSVMGT